MGAYKTSLPKTLQSYKALEVKSTENSNIAQCYENELLAVTIVHTLVCRPTQITNIKKMIKQNKKILSTIFMYEHHLPKYEQQVTTIDK